jgi:hypothetical protein
METQPNQTPPAAQATGHLNQLESFFDTYLHKKAPFHLPPIAKEWIVKYGPWITLVVMLFALPAIIAIFSFVAFFAPTVMYAGARGSNFVLYEIFNLAAFILEAVALPGLFKRSLNGWKMVYYAALVSAVGELLRLNIIGLIIGLVISMYFLFEIREYYK